MRTRSDTREINTVLATSREVGTSPSSGVVSDVSFNWPAYHDPLGETHAINDEQPMYERYGNVQHVANKFTAYPVEGSHPRDRGDAFISYSYSYGPYARFNRAIGAPGAKASLYDDILTGNTSWTSLSADALRAMVPSFNDRNSVVNFVLEAKDVKRIPDLWSKKRSFFKNVANLHLNYSFGIAPLVSDIKQLVDTLSGFRKKVADLQAGNRKLLTRHFTCRLPFVSLPAESVLYSEGGSAYLVSRRSTWWDIPRYHASMRFRYSLPDLTQMRNRASALLDSLGVRPNLQIPWNALRFSFVADWFVRVGKFLDGLSADNLPIPVVIEDFCHSVKYSIQNELIDTDFGNRRIVADNVISFYERRRSLPTTFVNAVHQGDFGLEQVLLGASLYTVNRRK